MIFSEYISKQQAKKHVQSGFSLIELLIAIAILMIISFLLVPGVLDYMKSAKKKAADISIKNFESDIKLYQLHVGKYPDRLIDLIKAPTDPKLKTKWEGPYIDENKLNDPWDNPYQYKLTPGGKKPYQLYSFGPEGRGSVKDEWIGNFE
jgi:general secretion pathway protein G